MAKRSNGEGSKYTDKSRPRTPYVAVVPGVGSKRFAVATDRDDWYDEQRARQRFGMPVEHRGRTATLAEVAEQWFAQAGGGKKPWHPRTRASHRANLDTYILPAFGTRQIGKLTSAEVQRWLNALSDGTAPTALDAVDLRRLERRLERNPDKPARAGGTVKNIYTTLSVLLGWATDRARIIPENVAALKYIDLPAIERRENEPLLPDQVGRLLQLADDPTPRRVGRPPSNRLAPLWRVLFTTGLRSAEVRGLRWRDVDLERGLIRVRHKLEEPDGKPWYFGELKTPRARREIPLIDQSRQALQAQKDLQTFERHKLGDDYYEDHDLVFADERGRRLSQSTMDVAYKAVLRRAGIDPTTQTIHDTRHACNTWLISCGVPLIVVQMIMGHSNAQMSRHYAHANELVLKAAGEALETYLARHQGAARG